MKKYAVVLASLLVVACNTPPKKDNVSPSQQPATNAAAQTAPANNAQTAANAAPGENQSIYFEYAKSAVAPEYSGIIQKEAQATKGAVTLEGNCDERGSAEYNLGLGQRRADAVKKLLVAAGAPGNKIKAVSLGEGKPKATCHNESCWKENRRVDFVQGS